jgi:hypothetical protein
VPIKSSLGAPDACREWDPAKRRHCPRPRAQLTFLGRLDVMLSASPASNLLPVYEVQRGRQGEGPADGGSSHFWAA